MNLVAPKDEILLVLTQVFRRFLHSGHSMLESSQIASKQPVKWGGKGMNHSWTKPVYYGMIRKPTKPFYKSYENTVKAPAHRKNLYK